MIRMICGSTCVDGQIVTPTNGAFSASAETEQRLVKQGVAEVVGVGASASTEGLPDDPFGDPADDTDAAREDGTPAYSEESTVVELLAIAKEYGIEVPQRANKAQLLEALDEFFGEELNIGVKEPE